MGDKRYYVPMSPIEFLFRLIASHDRFDSFARGNKTDLAPSSVIEF